MRCEPSPERYIPGCEKFLPAQILLLRATGPVGKTGIPSGLELALGWPSHHTDMSTVIASELSASEVRVGAHQRLRGFEPTCLRCVYCQ